ncbi:MAG: helix-turn-helix transcriptional regulator [Phycisphaeraceae bacterium]|nr:helix-turn-helix transcriptional regulator [Phycisphaeraceae bacterium]
MDDLREQVRARMEKLEMTTTELSRQTGIARPSIARWLAGGNEATSEWLDRLGEPLRLKIKFVRQSNRKMER